MSIGDVISQYIESRNKKKFEFCIERNIRLSLCGFIYFGPTMRFWYGALDRLVKSKTFFRPLKMLVIDQAFFAPCYMVTVLFVTKLARGQSPASIVENFPTDYPRLIFGSWTVWPWVQVANFTLIPLEFRVLFGNVVAVFWNTYVSRISNREQAHEGQDRSSVKQEQQHTSSSCTDKSSPK